MANRIAVQSSIEQPAGKPAVIIPDVFPVANQGDELANIHDILGGSVPYPLTPRKNRGWLRIAVPTGDHSSYIDPSLGLEEQRDIREGYRDTKTGQVVYDTVEEIARGMVRLEELVAKVRVGAGSVYMPRPERSLLHAWPVESARAFSGRIALDGEEKLVFGMHIPSGNELGWARILDPDTNSGESAKLQHEPYFQNNTYEEHLAALR